MFRKLSRRSMLSMTAIGIGSLAFSREATAEVPTALNIAVIIGAGMEAGWDKRFADALEKFKTKNKHNLKLTYKITDPIWGDDAAEAIRLFAESKQYDIIWAHSSYSDQVKKVSGQLPNQMFVVVGSGNDAHGGNQYWVYKRVHEPVYLMGVVAGRMTKSNVIGAVGTFPADDVNDEINAFFAGAHSVNPKIRQKVSFVEAWYDPAKSAEYVNAQVATGADVIFQMTGNFRPCEASKILCFGNHQDENKFSPNTIVSSAVINWDPDLNRIVDEWWEHKTTGKPYAGNTDKLWYGMKDAGAELAPLYGFNKSLPAPVVKEVEELKAKIISGEFKVPLDTATPQSN